MKPIYQVSTTALVLLIVLCTAGCESLPFNSGKGGELVASGVVEAVEVLVSSELAGRVAEVYVQEGDAVVSGDPLFRMEAELLEAQREQALSDLEAAQASINSARAGLELAQATLRAAEINVDAASAAAEVEKLPAEQALEKLYQDIEVARGAALKVVSEANLAVRDAQYQLDNYTVPINQQQYTAMEAVPAMKERLDAARQKFEPYKYKSSNDPTRKRLKDDLEDAQSDFDSAVRRLEYETNLNKAIANQDKAMKDLSDLQDGPDPDEVAVLEAQIAAAETVPKQANAAAESAAVGVSQAQALLEQAEAALAQAQAALNLVDIQGKKLVVDSAVDGVILVRSVQPGEVIQPGITAMTIGKMDELTVRVYIPEDRYGRISIGDIAMVMVDSFPGETFEAAVIRIADRAEYTPRNVQTQEDRKTIVFAIELLVNDPGGKLKPGMPVDVKFGEQP